MEGARDAPRHRRRPAVWGTTYIVTTELLPPGRPLLTAALRALPAGLLLLAVTRRLPHGDWWWRAAVLGTLNIGAFFALLFISAYRLPGGVAEWPSKGCPRRSRPRTSRGTRT
jgi:drug/metabolite transporter (DMT)-like permease